MLLMLVRRPDEHYISFFRWTRRPSRNDTRETYSAKLLLWTPQDLQTYMLWNLHHSKRASMAGRAWVGDPFASLADPLRCGPIIALAAGFHVFDLTADFDGTLRSIRDLTVFGCGSSDPDFLQTLTVPCQVSDSCGCVFSCGCLF